jgi:nucleotide-binding universal stress UspA family protein
MTTDQAGPVVAGVSTDYTAEHVVTWAAREARRLSAPLHLVHAYPPSTSGQPSAQWDPDATRRAATSHTIRVADRVTRLFPDLTVTTAVVAGSAAAALEAYATTARMIVVGRRRHGRLAEALLGSTTVDAAVDAALDGAASARCPVVAVPTVVPLSAPGATVVAAVAYPHEANTVVGYALAQAATHGAALRVVHCWPAEGRYYPQHRLQAQDELAHATQLLTRAFPEVPTQVTVIDGLPENVLVRESCDASLIVLGPVDGGWPHRLGQVGRAVLRGSPSPVVLLPHGIGDTAAPDRDAAILHSGR